MPDAILRHAGVYPSVSMHIEGPVVVSRKGQARIERGHPWVFRSDVVRDGGASPGAVVGVEGPRHEPLGYALWSSRSEIRLRMIERSHQPVEGFWRQRIERARAWRHTIAAGAEAYRVVHGEGDGLPGLVVDRYGDYLVLQTLSQATERAKPEIVSELVQLFDPRGIVERNDPRVRTLEGLEQTVSVPYGEVPETVEVREGDLRLRVDLRRGQKTGLFLDQRENHLAVRRYARGRALDCFTYDGGFALQMAALCDGVTAVDLSAESLERVGANAAANEIGNLTSTNANVFDLLRSLDEAGERFDTVVLDPPAFAKSRDAVARAERGYKEINLRALRILKPGGCLFTCSCSYHVHEDHFEAILADAATDAGVAVTVVEKRRQSRDHPVLLSVPETYYLKCFVLRTLA
ncbi:MAG TPA: class I SAM-dependent rRNA methyltransferase [Vicinamibacteria bacterium]|nr:class I SAM-dependent rRNA methyltransferase [Vicinamibacteria bacterium]